MRVLSVNKRAYELVQSLCASSAEYGVLVERTAEGATLIDAGIEAVGGFKAGRVITEVCMGGLGGASLSSGVYGDVWLPTISVWTDHPAVALLGSQFGGWRIKVRGFSAIGSGPARALALKPRELYDRIGYRDESDVAVVVLEASKKPPEEVVESLCRECRVGAEGLYMLLVPTASVAGMVQVSGRVAETGLHKLFELGLDPRCVLSGWGCAPVAPVHPGFVDAMGKGNDMILYGGVAGFVVQHGDAEVLEDLLKRAPSSASGQFGKPFRTIFQEAGDDFYKVDPSLFAPAVFVVNDVVSGRVFRFGKVDEEVLRCSLGSV